MSDVMKLRFYPMTVASGKGAILSDIEGNEYLDFNAGWGVANTGYGHPRIVKAVCEQMNRMSFTSPVSAVNAESVHLAEQLIALTPGAFPKKAWFGHSGSDANEFIAKIVPLATGRPRILTFVGSYHGQTMGSYAMSGHPAQSRLIGGGNVVKLPYPYCHRCPFGRDVSQCSLFCLKFIEEYTLKSVCEPDQIGAIVIEALQCDGGDIVPPDGFLEGLQAICRKHGILYIFDEVKVGFGRTGKMFGFENWDVVPDAVVMGKPLGGGQPLSAVVGRKDLMDAAVGAHLFTTAGNSVACASALETIKVIKEEGLMDNAAVIGAYLKGAFETLKKKYDVIADVRGKGLLLGIELVNKSNEPDPELTALVVYRSYELGLLYYYAGSFNNVLEFTPPLIITLEQAKFAVDVVERAIQDVLDGKVSKDKVAAYAGWG